VVEPVAARVGCTSCGAELAVGMRFCNACGAPAVPPLAQPDPPPVVPPHPPAGAVKRSEEASPAISVGSHAAPPRAVEPEKTKTPVPMPAPTRAEVRPKRGGLGGKAAAIVLVVVGGGVAWLALRDDGGERTDGSSGGGASDDGAGEARDGGSGGPPRSPEDRRIPSASSEAGGGSSGPRSTPPGTKGAGRLKPKEPPRAVVKDQDTLDLEKLLDAAGKEKP
jgi:hypothetical protein